MLEVKGDMMKEMKVVKNKILFCILFLLLLPNFILAQDFFSEANDYRLQGDYGTALRILQDNCPVLMTETFDRTIWKCNFNIAFMYENLASIYINGRNVMYNKGLLNLAKEYYKRSIYIYRLNPNDAEFSSSIFLAHIETSTGNYSEAIKILSDLENELQEKDLPISGLENGSEEHRKILETLPQLITISVDNLGSLKLYPAPSRSTNNQYSLNGIIKQKTDIPFIELLPKENFPDSIKICYVNFIGENQCKIIEKDQNNYFNLNENLILERKGDFPNDVYHTRIDIEPPILSKEVISIDTKSFYQGTAYYNDGLNLEIKRNVFSIIIFYVLFIIILGLLVLSNWDFKTLIIALGGYLITLFLLYDYFIYEFSVNFPWGSFNLHFYLLGLILVLRLCYKKPLWNYFKNKLNKIKK